MSGATGEAAAAPPPDDPCCEHDNCATEDDLSVTLSNPLQQAAAAAAAGLSLPPGGILSPSSLESAEYEIAADDDDDSSALFGGDSRQPTPLAVRAPWATPPRAAHESHKLSVTSPPLRNTSALSNVAPPADFGHNKVGGGGALRLQHPSSPPAPGSATSPESDFELHDLGESFPSTPTPVKWDTAR